MRKAIIPALFAVAVALVGFVTTGASGAPNKPTITGLDEPTKPKKRTYQEYRFPNKTGS